MDINEILKNAVGIGRIEVDRATKKVKNVNINGIETSYENIDENLKECIDSALKNIFKNLETEQDEQEGCKCIECNAIKYFLKLLKEDLDNKGDIYSRTLEALTSKIFDIKQSEEDSDIILKALTVQGLNEMSDRMMVERVEDLKRAASALQLVEFATASRFIIKEIITEIVDGKYDDKFNNIK
jgi:hypothetical protein